MEVLNTVTFCTNRLKVFPIASGKELKNEGRRSYNYCLEVNSGVHVIKWYDNKCIHQASALSRVAAAGTARQCYAKKSYIDVSLHDMAVHCNRSMGGVDLADLIIALYRTKRMVKKRWKLMVIFHALDICKINGWLLFRHHCDRQAAHKNG